MFECTLCENRSFDTLRGWKRNKATCQRRLQNDLPPPPVIPVTEIVVAAEPEISIHWMMLFRLSLCGVKEQLIYLYLILIWSMRSVFSGKRTYSNCRLVRLEKNSSRNALVWLNHGRVNLHYAISPGNVLCVCLICYFKSLQSNRNRRIIQPHLNADSRYGIRVKLWIFIRNVTPFNNE